LFFLEYFFKNEIQGFLRTKNKLSFAKGLKVMNKEKKKITPQKKVSFSEWVVFYYFLIVYVVLTLIYTNNPFNHVYRYLFVFYFILIFLICFISKF
jgi:uncharacterized membrane protein YozB (DUF420 family)